MKNSSFELSTSWLSSTARNRWVFLFRSLSISRSRFSRIAESKSPLSTRLDKVVSTLWLFPLLHNSNCIIIAVQTGCSGACTKICNALGNPYTFGQLISHTHTHFVAVIITCLFIHPLYRIFFVIVFIFKQCSPIYIAVQVPEPKIANLFYAPTKKNCFFVL